MTNPDYIARAKLDQLRAAAAEYATLKAHAEEEALRRAEQSVMGAKLKRDELIQEAEILRRQEGSHGLSMAAIKKAARIKNHLQYQQLIAGLDLSIDVGDSWVTQAENPFAGTFRANDWLGEILLAKFYGWSGETVITLERDLMNPGYRDTSGFYPVPPGEWSEYLGDLPESKHPEVLDQFRHWCYQLRSNS